jgi:hypothetical protein
LNEAELIQALADTEKGKALPSAILSMDKMGKMDAWPSYGYFSWKPFISRG